MVSKDKAWQLTELFMFMICSQLNGAGRMALSELNIGSEYWVKNKVPNIKYYGLCHYCR